MAPLSLGCSLVFLAGIGCAEKDQSVRLTDFNLALVGTSMCRRLNTSAPRFAHRSGYSRGLTLGARLTKTAGLWRRSTLTGAQQVWALFPKKKFAKAFALAASLRTILGGAKEWRLGNRSRSSQS